MKKFIDHIDHITLVYHLESLKKNVAMLEQVSGVKLESFDNGALGFRMYLSWEAGMEVMAPLSGRTEFNQPLHEHLEKCGEGVYAVVFGMRDLETARARLEKLGYGVGPKMDEDETSTWDGRVIVRERIGPRVMNSWFVLGQLDYRDDVITSVDA